MADILKDIFKLFASKGEKEATSKDINRWCTDAKVLGKNCNSNNLDIAFSKVKTKGKNALTFEQMEALIKELAKSYMKDKGLSNEEEAKADIISKLASAKPQAHGVTKALKVGGVDRMTDASKYTGAHKERFDDSGKGKGKEGRSDAAKNTGYVSNYKGLGSYGKK